MTRRLTLAAEAWPIAGSFTISRGSRTEASVLTVTLTEGQNAGRGECVPYPRYGESIESVTAQIEALRPGLEAGLEREELRAELAPGAARNAVDCALWDLAAKRDGVLVATRLGLNAPRALETAYTLSLGSPEDMRAAAERASERPLLKIKLGGEGDDARVAAVRAGAPNARIIADANEAWRQDTFARNMKACAEAGVSLVEQPLPAGEDDYLAQADRPVPVCADESLHVAADLAALRSRYDAVNIKLDKTGGLTEALDTMARAQEMGFDIMVGCMVGTSLAMAPAVLLAQSARYVDLDGPLLLARDRDDGLRYEGSTVWPPLPALWG